MKSTNTIIKELKGTQQDFEWYPTTDEIIDCVKQDMKLRSFGLHSPIDYSPNILDCGAGDGRVLEKLTKGKRYAIEKALPLVQAMDSSIYVIGADFEHQTLIDKKVDVIFSNPPYQHFERWAEKIIMEANAPYVYLVLPNRWSKLESIKLALELRDAKAEVLGSFDFLNADRKARALVEVVLVRLDRGTTYSNGEAKVDPFELWFDETYPDDDVKSKADESIEKVDREAAKGNKDSLVEGGNLISALERLHNNEFDRLLGNYKAISNVDPCVFAELEISRSSIKEKLKQRVKGVKAQYWKELFNNLDKVTSRLTSKSRKALLDTLNANTNMDFNAQNANAVLVWVIKNSNLYFDSQLIELVESMSRKGCMVAYKSNQRTFRDDDWYYTRNREELTRYRLDYRIILTSTGGISGDGIFNQCGTVNGLHQRAAQLLDDICTVANNIGFDTRKELRSKDFEWESGKLATFVFKDHKTGKKVSLMEVRAYLNGNLHIKFNQAFLVRLNVEFGRLKGWLKSSKEAADELEIDQEQADQSFASSTLLDFNDKSLLLTYKKAA